MHEDVTHVRTASLDHGGMFEGTHRIVHVTQPGLGGVADVVLRLASSQRDAGHQVTIVCPPDTQIASGADDRGLNRLTWHAERTLGPSALSETWRLYRLLRHLKPNIVHLHSSKAGFCGRLAARALGLPTIFQPHAWSFQARDARFARAAFMWELIGAWLTSHFVLVSDDELNLGRDIIRAGSYSVIHNGVNTRFYDCPESPSTARVHRNFRDQPTVVCVGRHCPQKGQDQLLDVWDAVRDRVPDAQLVLVGDGQPGAEQRSNDPSIIWAGPSRDVRRYYAMADLVAMPSRWEGMALVPLEAMACGRPVVAMNVGGAAQSIGDTGMVVQSAKEMSEAIVSVLIDPDRRLRLASKARARAVRSFDEGSTNSAVMELYSRFAIEVGKTR